MRKALGWNSYDWSGRRAAGRTSVRLKPILLRGMVAPEGES
jgi:hypothetical protein